MKKILSLLLAMTMLASMFTVAASANELGSIVFYDAADGRHVTYLDGVDNVRADVTFTANKTGTANVIAAHYDIETGKLEKMESIDSVSMTAGVAVEYTTNAIPVADTDLLKVYAWDEATLAPLTNAGTIERDLLEELPTATVSAIKADADFALNFVADEVTDEQLAFYGDWKADFVFVANKTAIFNANGTKDGYLVGQYDEFGPEFVKIPATDLTVTAGAPVSIMDAAGLTVTFRDVIETVKAFNCGVDYSDAYLKANNGLEVSIALVLVNPENGNTYTIAEKAFDFNMPTATVTEIDVADADFALNFKADVATESQVATFGDWKADFVFTTNKDATFNANGTKDGYLVGQYDEFGPEFVKVPAADYTVKAGVPVKVLETAGMNVTYKDVVETIKDFDCGVNFTDAYLKANDGLEVSLALVIVNPVTGEAYTIAEKAFDFTMPTATVTDIKVAEADFALNFKADEATESQVATFGDWKADFVFTTNKDATFNANGTKDGYLVGQYDEFGPEFVSIPAADYTVKAGVPVNVLATAGMNVTYKDVVETVKDFDCGVNFADSYLKANDGLEVSLALVIVNPVTGEAYTIAEKSFSWTLPTAEVTHLDTTKLDVEADFAMNFKANEATESQLATYGDWAADYVVTLSKDATFNANGTKDGYLLGQYDEFGAEWVKIPATDLAITAGVPVKVLETAGMSATYRDVVETIKDFDCGINFSKDYLAANDGVSATVELRIYNPLNPNESYVIGDAITRTWKQPTATVTELDVDAIEGVDLTFALNFKADAVTEEQLLMFSDWYADYELTVNKTATFNANGNADGFLSGQYDAWSKNWVSVPFEDATLEANTPVRVMETAAALMGQSGLKLTYADIVTSVKDFNCGLAFTPEFLVANPDLEVTLALKMYNPNNEDESYVIGRVYTFTPETIPSIDKFIGNNVTYTHTLETVEANTVTYDFADLFTVIDGVPVKMEDITVTGATYADGKITVEGFGEKVITVTDNYYCNEATATVIVNEPANVDKFTGNTVAYTHTLDTIEGNTATFNFDELFTNNGYAVKDITVEGATYADGKVTVEGLGTFTVTATDNFYCNKATATVVVNAPNAVDKWTGKAVTLTHTLDTIDGGKVTADLVDIFTAIGPVIMSQDVVVTVEGATVNKVASDWTQTTVDFTTPGEYTVTITDNYYCNIATATVTVVAPANVDKFVGKDIEVTHTLDTIESGKYTVNFADLFDTNGYEVKDITVEGATYADGKVTVEGLGTFTVTATDNFYCNEATATITVKEPANVDKWTATNKTINLTVNTVGQAQTVNFADLFKAVDGAIIKDVAVTVDGGSYADGVITVPGAAGTYTVTVTDNFYCNEASATITVNDAANVDKFTGKDIEVTHTLATIESNVYTVNFADLFDTNGYAVKDITVTGGTYADGKVTVEGLGTITVTATDNFYCNVATATITVNAPAAVDKWTATNKEITLTVDTVGVAQTVNFADLFTAVDGAIIKDVAVTVDGGSYADGVITVPGAAGTYTVTVTDNFYCNTATATIVVNDAANVDKFVGKAVTLTHTLETIDGGNVTATLVELFDAVGPVIMSQDVTVTVEGATVNKVASDWTQTTVDFTTPGEYTVTITDNFYCNIATATVTVKEPANVDKFTTTNKTIDLTVNTVGVAQTVNFTDLFTAVDGTVIKAISVTVDNGGSFADGVITVPGTAGTYTVTATDNFYCNEASATITVNDAANVDKFTGKTVTYTHTLDTIEGNTVTFDFAELFTNNGYAVKDITVTGGTYADGKVTVEGLGTFTITATDNFYCNEATATITVKEPANVDKWTGKTVSKKLAYGENTVIATLDELFTNNGYTTKTVVVGGDGTYANGVVTFTGAGTYTVTITDNFYCNTATATVTVADADPINKFTAKNPAVTHTLASMDAKAVSVKLGDIFGGTNVVTGNITVTIAGKATTVTAADWANATVTIPGTTGDVTVTINDNYYCNTATGKVTLKAPANQTKWTATNKTVNLTVATVGQNQTVNFSDLFTAVNGAYIKTATVTVNNGGSYANNVITVPGKAGTYTVTVTDNFYCNATTATITVNDAANVDKFTGKAVSKKLAYGSNTTTVTLGELFTAGSYTIKDVTVTGGTYAKGATWDKGTVTVTGTGTFTITITDNYYCNTAKATLTVAAADPINKFTAKNPSVTHTLASMDAKAVTVKLGDIFGGTNVVTGNITVTIAGKATTVTAADWANATVTIPGTTGDVTVTINDNYYCNTATGKVTLKAPANVDKWTTTNKTINLTLDNYGTAQSINFADMFTAKSGAYIKNVSVTVNNGGSYASNKITVPGKAGTYTVTVTDNFYCNTATATITVNNPAKVTKWTAKSGLAYEIDAGASKILTLADIFTLNNNYKVGTVTYTVEEQGTKTVSGTAWANTQVTFPGAGNYTVTITDDLFSDATYEATVKVTEKVVAPVQKFTVKDDYYFVAHDVVDPGSSNVKTIKLGDIFAASGEGTINSANVTVTTSNKVRKIEATITKNASDWTQTTIALKYSGEITLTITDGNGCVAASAIVATAPKWVGDVDAGDASSIAQAHYGTKTRTYNINVTVQPGKTGTFTLTGIPADGVYGIQWQNGYGIHGTPGTGEFSVNGYSDTSAVTSPQWSDAAGTDFLAYLKAGSNTITVKNVGDQPLAVYGNVNAMSLDKSGYDDEDFLPYLKDNGEGAGGGTVTPPEDTEWPVPEIAWSGKFSGHQYFGDYYGNSIVSPKVNATYAVGAYTVHTITIPNSGYEGVYVLQFKTTNEAAKIKATTADGYYADFNLTEDGWSSSCAQDQLIYLKKGANTIYVQNVGDASFVLTDIDIGYFDPGYETYYMYDVAQKADGTLPN